MSAPFKGLLVGCGGISNSWLKSLVARADMQLVGLVDLNERAARDKAAKWQLTDCLIGTDLVAALKQTQPDVVFDCTVPEAHVTVTLTALEHGCHVLGEKPMADTMANARKMLAAAEKTGSLYAVTQNYRYDPGVRRMKRFLQTGVLGPLTTLNADFYQSVKIGGFREHMPHVLLLDMAIHTFDMARFVTGADPVAAYAYDWNPLGSWFDHDASAAALFEMTDGLVFTYRGSWCAEGRSTTWASQWRIVGQYGTVEWPGGGDTICGQVLADTSRPTTELRDLPEWDTVEDGTTLYGHEAIFDEFFTCIREGGQPATVCFDNIKSLAMVHAAVQSAETGRKAEIRVD